MNDFTLTSTILILVLIILFEFISSFYLEKRQNGSNPMRFNRKVLKTKKGKQDAITLGLIIILATTGIIYSVAVISVHDSVHSYLPAVLTMSLIILIGLLISKTKGKDNKSGSKNSSSMRLNRNSRTNINKSYDYGLSRTFTINSTESLDDLILRTVKISDGHVVDKTDMCAVVRSGSRIRYRLWGGWGAKAFNRIPVIICLRELKVSSYEIKISFSPGGPRVHFIFLKRNVENKIVVLKSRVEANQ